MRCSKLDGGHHRESVSIPQVPGASIPSREFPAATPPNSRFICARPFSSGSPEDSSRQAAGPSFLLSALRRPYVAGARGAPHREGAAPSAKPGRICVKGSA